MPEYTYENPGVWVLEAETPWRVLSQGTPYVVDSAAKKYLIPTFEEHDENFEGLPVASQQRIRDL